ncbi:MAG: TraB/GumN family protein [Chitinophagales bacterium]|nr:TraB/GumN family protein [Chitinophagales bacterium]
MKHFLITILTLITSLSVTAQKPKEKTLLWKIEGNNISTPSYIFGTFHLLCSEDFHLPDTLKSLIAKTQQVFFEIDLDDPSISMKMMKNIKMKEGKTLKDFMTKEEYDSATVLFKAKTGMPLKMVESYKPFMLTSMLYQSLMGCKIVAFEKEIEKLAKINHQEIKGLETVEEQLNIFEKIPYRKQAEAFKKLLFDEEEGRKQMDKMIALYKSKNIKAMHKSVKGDTDLGNYDNNLVDKRNQNWIPIIEKEIALQPIFIAVGAGHLGGKKGVIYLLRKKGYKVTPIMY